MKQVFIGASYQRIIKQFRHIQRTDEGKLTKKINRAEVESEGGVDLIDDGSQIC